MYKQEETHSIFQNNFFNAVQTKTTHALAKRNVHRSTLFQCGFSSVNEFFNVLWVVSLGKSSKTGILSVRLTEGVDLPPPQPPPPPPYSQFLDALASLGSMLESE